MQYKLHALLAVTALGFGSLSLHAQTVASFENLTLPGTDTSYLEVIPPVDGTYSFETGNTKFYGKIDYGGGYQAQFNYSNRTDTVTPGYENMWAAVTGGGADGSDNYGITYAETDFSDFTQSPENGPKLTGTAAGHKVAGVYVTNSTVAYRWIKANYENGDWYKVIIRGYLNNVRTADSVEIMLAKYSATDTILVNTWEWVNLLPLGDVDSITFQTKSNVDVTPYYFAIDNLTTLDGDCPATKNIAAVSINENSATINWANSITGFTANYEIAVDQSATLAPTATAVPVTGATTYNAASLMPNTLYYAHVRSSCGNGSFSDWDTASLRTLQGTGIFNTGKNSFAVTLSPNPATDLLNIAAAIPVNAVVYSIEGKQLLAVTKAKQINIAGLPAGMYLLKLTDTAGKQSSTLRFTKNK